MRCRSNIDLSSVRPDDPLRLDVAARLAFPDGSLTKSGLRREIARGNLECEVIAGKHFVTLAGIERMRALCRVNRKDPVSTFAIDAGENPLGSSLTDKTKSALAAAQTIAEALKKPSLDISPENTGPTGKIVTLPR